MPVPRSHIRCARHQSRRHFALEREVEVVGPRNDVLIAERRDQHGRREDRPGRANRVICDQIEVSPSAIWIGEWSRGACDAQAKAVGRRIDGAVPRLAVATLIVEAAAAAAKAGLAVAGDVPGEPEAGTGGIGCGFDTFFADVSGVSTVRFAARRCWEDRGSDVGIVVGDAPMHDAADLLMPRRRVLVPQAEVQRDAIGHFEIVLRECLSVEHAVILVLACALIERADLAEHEVR